IAVLRPEARVDPGQPVRLDPYVVVCRDDDVPLREAEAVIERRAASLLALERVAERHGKAGDGALDDLARVVRRVVVDDDHFPRRAGPQMREAGERVAEERGAVVGRDQDRESHSRLEATMSCGRAIDGGCAAYDGRSTSSYTMSSARSVAVPGS